MIFAVYINGDKASVHSELCDAEKQKLIFIEQGVPEGSIVIGAE